MKNLANMLVKFFFQVREHRVSVENHFNSLSGLKIPKIAVPNFKDLGEIVEWLGLENFPGNFPGCLISENLPSRSLVGWLPGC